MSRVLIAAGGTGGHVYPALAVAAQLRDRGHDVAFAGGTRLEAAAVPEAGFVLHRVPGRGLPRRPTLQGVLAAADLIRSVRVSRRLIRETATDVVLGMGGYVSVGPCVAGGMLGLPVVLHEQNAHLALSHRLCLRWASALALSLPLPGGLPRGWSSDSGGRRRATVVGNPLRPQIAALAMADEADRRRMRSDSRSSFGLDPSAPTLLAFGGSLGGRAINECLPPSAGSLPAHTQILHIAGSGRSAPVSEAYAGSPVRVVVVDYVADMQRAYAAADVAVTRSGGAVAELTALGLPSVLVPGSWATGGHQEANARALEAGGATVVVIETQPELQRRLTEALATILTDDSRRATMGAAARAMGRPRAAGDLAELVESLARSRGREHPEPPHN